MKIHVCHKLCTIGDFIYWTWKSINLTRHLRLESYYWYLPTEMFLTWAYSVESHCRYCSTCIVYPTVTMATLDDGTTACLPKLTDLPPLPHYCISATHWWWEEIHEPSHHDSSSFLSPGAHQTPSWPPHNIAVTDKLRTSQVIFAALTLKLWHKKGKKKA